MSCLGVLHLVLAALTSAPVHADAFPGAVGFGVGADGWRGGRIIRITNLDDSGPGSFRECATSAGPRVCVFDVAGTIFVDSPIHVASNVYLAGQTAPGTVQLRLRDSQGTPLVIKEAESVLVRFLKVRPGASTEPSPSVDAITVEDSQDVYLDHLSLQFATDENFNVHANRFPTRDITLARSIVALGLDRANHPKGRHSKGALICSTEGPTGECGRVSLIGNVFAHNRDRNPDVKGTRIGPIEVIDNVFYDPISQFGEFYNLIGETTVIYEGNTALAGPSTVNPTPAAVEGFLHNDIHPLRIVARGNRNIRRKPCGGPEDVAVIDSEATGFLVDPTSPGDTPARNPDLAYRIALSQAGARDPLTGRLDGLDAGIIRQIERCAGRVIDRPEEAGGWPDLISGEAPSDRDGDGMPDDWELARGLDPFDDGDAWADRDGNGWSELEDYLEDRARAAVR